MDGWKNIDVPGVVNLRRCVAEFEVHELNKTPQSKFKVKIFEDKKGRYTGYTNLMVRDSEGCPFPGVGNGKTIEEALHNTLTYFFELLNEKETWEESDFDCSDAFDF